MPDRLTPAGRRFVEALCEGGTLPQIAARLGIAYEIARARLKQIYRLFEKSRSKVWHGLSM